MVILGGVGTLLGRRDRRGGAARRSSTSSPTTASAGSPRWRRTTSSMPVSRVGIVLLAIVLFAPEGIAGLFARKAMLELRGVTKRFGGVVATDNVTLDVRAGRGARAHRAERRRQDHAHRPDLRRLPTDTGRIVFDGADVTRLRRTMRACAPASRAATRSPASSGASACSTTSRSRCRRAAARASRSGGRSRPSARCSTRPRAIAGEIGLAERLDVMAATLAHGEQRALEVGLALATRPQARAARRADGRHGAGGIAAHDRAHRADPRAA